MNRYIVLNPLDNVAVATTDLAVDDLILVNGLTIQLVDSIPTGHKFALADFSVNANIIKYGYPIGHATQEIKQGEHIHTHNIKTNLNDNLQYFYTPKFSIIDIPTSDLTVNGFLRKDGRMGIRNELWIVPTVGCVNGLAQAVIDRAKRELDLSHIDDIRVYSHSYGCSQLGDDLENTQMALAAVVKHPNAGGVLVMSLGCENNQIDTFKEFIGDWDKERVRFLVCQKVKDEIEEGFLLIKELIAQMKKDVREMLPLSMLKVGLKCGGSDGFSGITANPLVGQFSDWLIAQGGSTILTEVPEMFGAETLLMNRAIDISVFKDIVALINNFKNYFRTYDQPIYENPSPGNKAGGISTLEDKSLGCTQKGGTSPVVGVLDYTEQITHKGLNLLNAPGNDLVATSALAMSGCQLVLFTTGRGTPFGSFVPTLKISTNSSLYEFKPNWIDFDAGTLLEGEVMENTLQRLIAFIIDVCNGKQLSHEKTGFKEVVIFKSGVTL